MTTIVRLQDLKIQKTDQAECLTFMDNAGDLVRVTQLRETLFISKCLLSRRLASELAWVILRFANSGSLEGPTAEEQMANVSNWLQEYADVRALSDADLIDAVTDIHADHESAHFESCMSELCERYMRARGILETPRGLKSEMAIVLEESGGESVKEER